MNRYEGVCERTIAGIFRTKMTEGGGADVALSEWVPFVMVVANLRSDGTRDEEGYR